MNKQLLTEEEIKDLKDYQDTNLNHIYLLGQIEYQKILLNKEKEKLIEDIIKAEAFKEVLSEKISSKYGSNASIDLENGTISV